MGELEIEFVGGNDLLAKTRCNCNNDELFKDKPELGIKRQVRLWGYSDNNFFENVNANKREGYKLWEG